MGYETEFVDIQQAKDKLGGRRLLIGCSLKKVCGIILKRSYFKHYIKSETFININI